MLFNEKPAKGIEFCIMNRLIKKNDPLHIGRFLKKEKGLSKFSIGQFLGSEKTDKMVVVAYFSLFDFKGKPIDVAMRHCFEKFRLPGEG